MAPHAFPPRPPFVPERPPRPTSLAAARAEASQETEKSDAEKVLSMLDTLEKKITGMGDRFDDLKIQGDLLKDQGMKSHMSLRRRLKVLMERSGVSSSEDANLDAGSHINMETNDTGDYPCCICNYCLKRTHTFLNDANDRQCCHLRHV